jgi:hypothetical protein
VCHYPAGSRGELIAAGWKDSPPPQGFSTESTAEEIIQLSPTSSTESTGMVVQLSPTIEVSPLVLESHQWRNFNSADRLSVFAAKDSSYVAGCRRSVLEEG